jgi:acyl carrier protein
LLKTNILERLKEVFEDVFDEDFSGLNSNFTADDVEGWDSLGNLQMCVTVENTMGIKFSISEIENAFHSDVGALVQVIQTRLRT